jgi:hypothetical protein
VFERAQVLGLKINRGPAPLPFLESRYSPEAYPAELVPPDLKSEVEVTFLGEYLNRMPVPVVRLPPTCLKAPWSGAKGRRGGDAVPVSRPEPR